MAIGDGSLLRQLEAALSSGDAESVLRAAEALDSASVDPSSVLIDLALATRRDPDLRRNAARALCALDVSAARRLAAHLADATPSGDATWLLAHLSDVLSTHGIDIAGEHERARALQDTRRALDAKDWDALVRGGSGSVAPVVEALREALQSTDWPLVYSAIEALGKLGGEDAVATLTNLLAGDESLADEPNAFAGVKRAAAEALGEIGSADTIEPLSAALRDADGNVGAAAAVALGRIGSAAAVGPLIECLGAHGWMVVGPAAEALGRMRAPAAVRPLIEILGHGDWSYSHWRTAAARALGHIGDPTAVIPLVKALEREWEDANVRRAAGDALADIGSPAGPELARLARTLLDIDGRRAAAAALERLGLPPALPVGVEEWDHALSFLQSRGRATAGTKTLGLVLRERHRPRVRPHGTYHCPVDYGRSVEDAVNAGRYDEVDPDITSRNFPSERTDVADVTVEMIWFDQVVTARDALTALDIVGFRPATLVELLAFGEKYAWERETAASYGSCHYVVALGSAMRGDRVPYIFQPPTSSRDFRRLALHEGGNGFGDLCRFAAVRKAEATRAPRATAVPMSSPEPNDAARPWWKFWG